MRIETETYAIVSYEEVAEAQHKAEEAKKEFLWKHKNFLITCLCKVGFADKRVRVKKTGDMGVLRVEEYNSLSFLHPYELRFYPIKKNGEISLKSRYVNGFFSFREKDTIQQLLDIFELVEDTNES